MSDYHIPVMPLESMEGLNIQKGSWYIDCNLGGGGHTAKILEAGGKVIGIDLDLEAIEEVAKNFKLSVDYHQKTIMAQSDNLILAHSNFSSIEEVVQKAGVGLVMGVFYDLGVSSAQLEKDQRGFSFNKDAPLDMRMDQSSQIATAADLVNGLHEGELTELFTKLGEENFAKPIARRIVQERANGLITTTNQLANVVLSVRRRSKTDRTHPATRVFQALRIAVNDELNSLRESLPQALTVLAPGGRLVVISFHSLEDRIVKNYFNYWEEEGKVKLLTKKPLEPTEKESQENPRARSGKLRIAEKI